MSAVRTASRSPSHIWVYIDNTKVGGVQSLAAISTRYIASVRKVNGIDATARWGIGHSAGVIAVMTWPPQDDSLPRPPRHRATAPPAPHPRIISTDGLRSRARGGRSV